MEISFSNPEEAEKKTEELLKQEEEIHEVLEAVELDSNKIVRELYEAVKILKDKASWTKNIRITNKKEERNRFKQLRSKNKDYIPDFDFKEFPYSEKTFVEFLDTLEGEVQKINTESLEKYGFKEITVGELQLFFEEIFEELKLYVKLAANVEDEEKWRRYSEELWPMIDEESFQRAVEEIEEIKPSEDSQKEITAEDLKEMWIEELERLGVDYNVEIREVNGCFNIPEEQTVVVAKGSEDERFYTREEARMLTMHELFHVVRAYNGLKAGKESGFPPILGVHTPFYDMTEEGGALYREDETGTSYTSKEFDYHLRLLAAYYMHQGLEFQGVVEKLAEHGGDTDRCFDLAARNREILRHHIYLQGEQEWRDREDLWPLLIGKLNPKWADMFREEAENNGAVDKPEVWADDLFDFRFKD